MTTIWQQAQMPYIPCLDAEVQLYVKVKHRRHKVDFDAMTCVRITDGLLQTHKQKHRQRQRLCHGHRSFASRA